MANPKIHAVTFDMDGLMFNTEDLYDYVGSVMLQRRGHVFSRELKLKMMGRPGPQAFEILQSETGWQESFESFQIETDEIFAEILPTRLRTMPGLEQLLDRLERCGIPKAIATSSHRAFAETVLGSFDLLSRFEFYLTREDVSHGKPDPEIYLTSAARMQVEPSCMLVLEDSVIGSMAAVAAGAFTIAVPTKHSEHQDFSHVQGVAKSLNDAIILNLLTGS